MLKTIKNIIYPLEFEEFIRKYQLQRAVKIKKPSGHFDIKFNWKDLNELLNTNKVPYNKMELLQNGTKLPEINSTFNILQACRNGATLILNDIDLHNIPLRELVFSLSNEIKTPVKTQLFASYPGQPEYHITYDSSDTFIFQLEGKKSWQIFPPNVGKAVQEGTFNPETYKPYLRSIQEPGDVLYIPRMHWFRATALEPSLHIAVKINYKTGWDFLSWFINNELTEVELFRKSFPLVFRDESFIDGDRIPESWESFLDELTEEFLNRLEDEHLIAKYYDFLVKMEAGVSPYVFPYPFLEKPVETLENNIFTRPEYQETVIEKNKDNSVSVFVWTREFKFGQKLEDFVNFVFSNNEFSGEKLVEEVPDISKESLLDALNILLREGIIQIKNNSPLNE